MPTIKKVFAWLFKAYFLKKIKEIVEAALTHQ
jgi:hypothetical protein